MNEIAEKIMLSMGFTKSYPDYEGVQNTVIAALAFAANNDMSKAIEIGLKGSMSEKKFLIHDAYNGNEPEVINSEKELRDTISDMVSEFEDYYTTTSFLRDLRVYEVYREVTVTIETPKPIITLS